MFRFLRACNHFSVTNIEHTQSNRILACPYIHYYLWGKYCIQPCEPAHAAKMIVEDLYKADHWNIQSGTRFY